MLHDTEDALIDVRHTNDLYQKSNKEKNRLVIVPNGTQNDLGRFEEYQESVNNFLELATQ